MKREELRIGNWFVEFEVPIRFDGDFYHLCGVNPILITEKWLLKFGFKMENKSYFYKPPTNTSKYEYIYTVDLNGDWYLLINESIKIYVKHVHHLQNIYFSITGIEL